MQTKYRKWRVCDLCGLRILAGEEYTRYTISSEEVATLLDLLEQGNFLRIPQRSADGTAYLDVCFDCTQRSER
jgi:hypothetical protein